MGVLLEKTKEDKSIIFPSFCMSLQKSESVFTNHKMISKLNDAVVQQKKNNQQKCTSIRSIFLKL